MGGRERADPDGSRNGVGQDVPPERLRRSIVDEWAQENSDVVAWRDSKNATPGEESVAARAVCRRVESVKLG